MDRRTFMLGAAAVAGCATTPVRQGRANPNVVLVLCDDLGYGDLGVYGNRLIRTPNIDRMAAEGARLSTFFASANICTPSRAGLLTGRYPVRTGLGWQVIQADDTRGLPLSEVTIAAALRPDYATALVGKWHLGHVAPYWPPTRHGFDLFYGLPYSHDMKPLHLYRSTPAADGVEIIDALDFAGPAPQPGDTLPKENYRHLTELFFRRGLQFIDDNRDRPFFLMLALTAPHVPLDPHPGFEHHSQVGDYGDVVEEVDANVGRLLAKLKQLDLDQDTLVLLLSDNGPWFQGSAGQLRERKGGAAWDGGYRVPFIARQPGRIPAGLTSDAMAMNIDLLPTILAWAGRPLPAVELDGADISRLLTTPGAASPHDQLVLFNNEDVAAIRTARWKLAVRSYYRGIEAALDTPGRDDWRLLVDLQSDPAENYDVSAMHPEVLADMTARLAAARAKFAPFAVHKDTAPAR